MIDKFVELAKINPDVDVMWLYGSQAKGTATSTSDYDIAIAFRSFPKDILERRLRPETLAIDWSHALSLPNSRLSIVDINMIPIPLAWEVISSGKVIHVKNEIRQIREEQRISSMYELNVLYHRRHYAA